MAKTSKRKSARRRASRKRPSPTSTAAPSPAPNTTISGAAGTRVTVRHYCQGIGDCHLLKFPKQGGGDFFMLIDCGVHSSVTGGPETIRKIVDDIASVTRHIDVVVATHEHWDHVSGFATAAASFKKITFGEAWMAWTENPADAQAAQLDKFKGQAIAALQASAARLGRAGALAPHLAAVRDGVESVLGFHFGAKGERVRDARNAILQMTKNKVRYFESKDSPLSLPGVGNVRVYVLGPPRDAQLLGLTERESEMYGLGGAGGSPLAVALSHALSRDVTTSYTDYAAPFDPNQGTPLSELSGSRRAKRSGARRWSKSEKADAGKIAAFWRKHYAGPAKSGGRADDASWRRVDNDWLSASADLAIQLDSKTNNSSLVLAFEFVDTKRVLLFVGDAQVGNWLSWQDLKWTIGDEHVTGPDLLARTVFYKVGHHGSHNATLKAKGLELMTSSDFAAFIPTNQQDALKVKWGAMPFKGILDDLRKHGHDREKDRDRVIRADDPWIAGPSVPADFPISGSIRGLRHQPGLWVELDLA